MKKLIFIFILIFYPFLIYSQNIKEIYKYDVPNDFNYRHHRRADLLDSKNLLILGQFRSPYVEKKPYIAQLLNLSSSQFSDFINLENEWRPLLAAIGDDGFRYGIYQKDYKNYIIKADENGKIIKKLSAEKIIEALDMAIDDKGTIYILGELDEEQGKNYLLHAYDNEGEILWHAIDISDFKEDIDYPNLDSINSFLKIRDENIYAAIKNRLFTLNKEGKIKKEVKLQIEDEIHLIDFINNNVICIAVKNARINANFSMGIYNNEGALIRTDFFKFYEKQKDKEIYRFPYALNRNRLLIEEFACNNTCEKKFVILEIEL